MTRVAEHQHQRGVSKEWIKSMTLWPGIRNRSDLSQNNLLKKIPSKEFSLCHIYSMNYSIFTMNKEVDLDVSYTHDTLD